ncbi:hypothetical protein GQR58_008335 [Nymphon striatum]|nr:hypothetical protein GQR58_008335 [Nymphon striatum]
MMNSKKINKLQRSSNHSSQKLCSRETENNNNIDDQDFIFLHGISRDAYKKSNYCGDDIILKESSSMSNYSLKYLDFEKINLPEENIKPNDVLSLSCITTIKNTNDLSVPRSLSYCVSNFNNTAIQSNKNVNEDDLVPNEDKLQRICKNLAHHLPKLFIHRQDYSIYHHNIIFYNNITGVTKEGLQQYSMYLSKIKALGHLLYARINMNILKITSHPEDGTVRIRWRISIVTFWKLFSKFRKYIDGFSIFYIGNDGLIYKHECDEVMPDDNYEISKSKKPGWMALIFSGLTRDSSNSLKSSVFRTGNLKMDKKEARAVIKYLNKKGTTPEKIHEAMVKTLGEDYTILYNSYTAEKKWVADFKWGKESTEGDSWSTVDSEVLAEIDEDVDQENSQLIKTMKDAAIKANSTSSQLLSKFSATTLELMKRRNDLIIRIPIRKERSK